MTYYGRFETSPLAQTLGDTSTIDYTGFHTSPLSKAAGDSTINFRGFHTSPLSQAVGDSSTIDYMRFPDFDPDLEPEAPIRVPLLPQSTLTPTTISYAAEEQAEEETGFRPEVVTASADGTFHAAPSILVDMQDPSDLSYEGIAHVQAVEARGGRDVPEDASPGGTLSRVFSDMITDIIGPDDKKPKAT